MPATLAPQPVEHRGAIARLCLEHGVEHRDAIARLCDQYGVERLEVFGSAADGRFDPARSDFDFIARFSPEGEPSLGWRFVTFADALERLLGRPVDLLTRDEIENPYLRRRVDASRSALYVREAREASE